MKWATLPQFCFLFQLVYLFAYFALIWFNLFLFLLLDAYIHAIKLSQQTSKIDPAIMA